MRAREIAIGNVPLLASRVTYVGELGWELYAPAEYGLGLYDLLTAAGAGHGLRGGGYRAIESMRLEKGYRAWGSDLTPETTPESAGHRLRRAARQGHARSSARRRCAPSATPAGPAERLACLVLDDPRSVCLGSEPVRIAGELLRPRHLGRLREPRAAQHRARLRARRARRGRYARRDRGVRRVGTGRGGGGGALRSSRRAHSRLIVLAGRLSPSSRARRRRARRGGALACAPGAVCRRAHASAGSTTSA